MKARLLTTIILLIIIACNQLADRKTQTTNCKPYFTFDNVEHYTIAISEDSIHELDEKEQKTIIEDRLIELLLRDTPDKLSDTTKLINIEALGFKKKKIQTDNFEQLQQIFCERKHEDGIYSVCIPVYRDFLIFKKANKIVGFSKICFDCGDSIIAGTDKDWTEFGQSGDLQKLKAILDNLTINN